MSTVKQLTARALTSPTRRAILQYLQMHGECTREQLGEAVHGYASWRIVADSEPAAHERWLGDHLRNLRAQGHVSKRINDAGVVVYFAGTDAVATGSSVEAAEPPEPDMEKAAPRHINVMHGQVYQPAPWAPARAGALDHARLPSVMGSQRVPFRGAQ